MVLTAGEARALTRFSGRPRSNLSEAGVLNAVRLCAFGIET